MMVKPSAQSAERAIDFIETPNPALFRMGRALKRHSDRKGVSVHARIRMPLRRRRQKVRRVELELFGNRQHRTHPATAAGWRGRKFSREAAKARRKDAAHKDTKIQRLECPSWREAPISTSRLRLRREAKDPSYLCIFV